MPAYVGFEVLNDSDDTVDYAYGELVEDGTCEGCGLTRTVASATTEGSDMTMIHCLDCLVADQYVGEITIKKNVENN